MSRWNIQNMKMKGTTTSDEIASQGYRYAWKLRCLKLAKY